MAESPESVKISPPVIKPKEYKIPGIGGAKAAQIRKARNQSAEDTKDEEWQPLKPVIIDLDSNFRQRYTQQENYRAYKLFNIIDTTNSGSISLRELKRCLMGDTFRTFNVKFDHPDSGFVFGLDEDNCVMVDEIEKNSPASLDPFLLRGLQIWKVNGTKIAPNDPKSLDLIYKALLTHHDEAIEFEIVEPILQITQFSNIIDIEAMGEIYSVQLPIGAVYNLHVFEKKMRRAMVQCNKVLKDIKLSFDGRRRQVYFRCEEFPFALLLSSGPNFQRSSRYALGFSSEDSPMSHEHKGQPMVFDLDLGVKPQEAETVLAEIFMKFDADGSGEFEFEEFRDFYIKFLDTDDSIDLLRRYAQYRFRDLEKEAYYYEQIRLRKYKKERRKMLVEKERPLRKKQTDHYFKNSAFDIFGIRRRIYDFRASNFLMPKPGKSLKRSQKSRRAKVETASLVAFSESKDGVSSDSLAKSRNSLASETVDGEDHNDEERSHLIEDKSLASSVGEESAGVFVRLTPDERLIQRQKMKATRKKHDLARKLRLNEIFAQNATIARQNRKDALQMKGTLTSIHMQDIHHALKLARKTAVRTEDSGVSGITKMNVSFTHVIATPALIISATMFTDQVDNDDIELENMPSSKLHPAVQRYFLIRESKRVNAEFDSYMKHPAFFTADYEREPSRHSSFGMGICKLITRQLEIGIQYRKEHGIVAKFDHVPEHEKKYRPSMKVKWRKPDPPLKSDRLVCRITVLSIRVTDLPTATGLVNSPFVSVSCGDYRYSSEVNSLAGSTSQWDFERPGGTGLSPAGWEIRIRAKDVYDVFVYTGTVTKNTLIGKASISALELADKPIDKDGILEVMMQLYGPNGRSPRGSVYFKFFMEQGTEWDWFRADYMRKQAELQKKKKFEKWLLRRANAPKTILPFPLKFTVVNIKAFDLQPVHMMLSNSPYITFEYGDANKYTSDVKESAGYEAEWNDLGWLARCSTRRNNMIFMVHSGYSVIGRFTMTGAELNKLPRSKGGHVTILGALTMMPPNKPIQMGRITVNAVMDTSNAILVGAAQHTMEDLETIADSSVDYSSVTYISDYTPIPPTGILPVRAKLLYVAVAGITPEIGGKAYSPSVLIQCGRWFKTTDVQNEKGGNAEWKDIDWYFPVNDRMDIIFKLVISKGKDNKVTKELGSFSCTAKNFVDMERNKKNILEYIDNLTDGATIVGKIKFIVHFDHEGDEGFVTDMIDKALKVEHEEQEALKRKLKDDAFHVSGYGDGIPYPATETSDGYKLTESKPFMFSYLPESRFGSHPDRIPFRMTITSILAIDMKPAHTFSANSPHLNAACGSWAAISTTVVNAGTAASWSALGWGFFVYEKKNLRIAVWSEGILIGIATYTPETLLAIPVDKVGKCDIASPIMDGIKSAGQVKLSYFLESMFDEVELDSHRFLPDPIKIDPPLRMTLFTVACNGLRSVHLFSANSPLIKAACGKFYASTQPINNSGKNAKWEEIGWFINITREENLKITVQSDSVVIGFIILSADELVQMPIDKYGLTEIEANLNDDRSLGDTGRIRIVCRLESHVEEETVGYDHDDEDDKVAREMKANQIWKTLPDGSLECIQIPRVVNARVLGITVADLKSVHSFSSNSPHVVMESGTFISGTSVQPFRGNKASWLDLGWTYYLTSSSTIKVTVNSGTKTVGYVHLTTQELYEIPTDDLKRTLVRRNILFEGVPMGTLKIQYILEEAKDKSQFKLVDELKEDVDFKRFNFDENQGAANEQLAVPVLVKIVSTKVIDLAPMHGGFITNSPYIQMTCGGFSRESNARLRGGKNASWDDMDWAFVIMDENALLQVSVMSGWSRAGTLSMSVESLLRLPRGKNGEVDLQGSMVKEKNGVQVSKGKVFINMIIQPYVSEEEQKRLDELALDELREKSKLPRVLAMMEIQAITVSHLVQVYGLFKNSPKVDVSLGDWRATTGIAFNAGSFATWRNLGWTSIPIRDKTHFAVEVSSGNETLGVLKMTSVQLVNIIPVSSSEILGTGYKIVEVKGQLKDGIYAKGMVSLTCKLDVEGIAAINELQQIMHMQGQSIAGSSMTSGTGRLMGDPGPSHKYIMPLPGSPERSVSLLENSVASWASDGRSQEIIGEGASREYSKRDAHSLDTHSQVTLSSQQSINIREPSQTSVHIGEAAFAQEDKDEDTIDEVIHPSLQSITSLSLSTPTPVATRVVVLSISVQDLKKVHHYSSNNPEVVLECGDFYSKTTVAKKAGARAFWDDLSWVFVMKRMTFIKLTVETDGLPIGSVSISTRELISMEANAEGNTAISRNVTLNGEATGKIKMMTKISLRESIGMASTEQMQKRAGDTANINKKLIPPPQLPMTVRIIRITVIDLEPLHLLIPNSPFAQITCGHWKKRTKSSLAAGSNTQWTDLPWTLNLFDAAETITIAVISGSTKGGSKVITAGELLGMPRSQQGYTEISGTLWSDKGLHAGQIVVTTLLSPYISDEEQEVLKAKAEAQLNDEGRTPRLLAYLSIDTVSCLELTEIYKTLDISASLGKWKGSKTSESTTAKGGQVAWGKMKHWESIAMYEKLHLMIEVSCPETDKIVGVFTMSAKAIMSVPAEENGGILLFGNVMDGDVCVGKMSIGGTIEHKVRPKQIRRGSVLINDEAVISTVKVSAASSPDASSREPRWSEACVIEGITCSDLKSVHTLGKNSPQVKLECGNWKDQTPALPYAGKSAEWGMNVKASINWEHPSNGSFRIKKKGPLSSLKIVVLSSSVIIGTVNIKGEDFLEAERTKKGKLLYSAELSKYNKVTGVISLHVQFLEEGSPKAKATRESAAPPKFDMAVSQSSISVPPRSTLHIIEEDKDDYSELLDPTFVGGQDSVSLNSQTSSPTRPDLQLSFPLGFEYSYSGTSLSHVEQPLAVGSVTESNARSGGSARPRTSRGEGASTQRSLQSNPSWPTERSDNSSYYTDRSYSDGGSLYSSRYSSARSDFYSSRSNTERSADSDYSRDRSEYSQSDTERSSSSRGDSYYYNGYNTGRTGDTGSSYSSRSYDSRSSYTQSSRSDYSDYSEASGSSYSEYSRSDTERSEESKISQSSKSRKSIAMSAGELSGSKSDSDSESESHGELEISDDHLQRTHLSQAHPGRGFTPKTKVNAPTLFGTVALISPRHDPNIEFDISSLRWWKGDSSAHDTAKSIAREFVRGLIHATIQSLAAECTGQSFVRTVLNSGYGSCFPLLSNSMTFSDIVLDASLIVIKSAVQVGGLRAVQKLLQPSQFIRASALSASQPASAEATLPPAPQFKKRQAMIFTEGFYNTTKVEWKQEDDARKIDYDDKVFGKVRGLFTVPILKAQFTILDVMGFDISNMDRRVLPVRPYMTACKPYSDWAAETGPLWFNNRGLLEEDMKLGYRDLSGQWGWTPLTLRLGQNLIFDWHDSGSGLIFAKLRIQYEMLEEVKADEDEIITLYVEAEIANEYGGGVAAGVIRFRVDLQCNFWQRPLKPPEYWDQHRVHHWKTFPLPTISAGQVKSHYRAVARDYDQQMYIHPALFGFRMRWRCDPHKHDESRFINPIFQGFTLAKKPPTKRMEEDARKKLAMKSSPNPWHWDVTAHLRGKCPVCGDGLPGCPRCWMMPTRPNGDLLSPEDFQFDPEMEAKRIAEEEMKRREREAQHLAKKKRMQRLLDAGKIDMDDIDSDDETDSVLRREQQHADEAGLKKDEIHTKLTTFKGLRMYRAVTATFVTVYVKVLPGAYIRKIVVRPEDTVYHLWNMFCSHADLALSDNKMFILPSTHGFFEMHGENEVADEKNLADNRGMEPLSRYGIIERGSTITLMFLPKYIANYTVSLLQSFFLRNTSYRFEKSIITYDHVDERLPPVLHGDPIQEQLSAICSHLYELQQKEYKRSYEELGYLFRMGSKADIEAKLKAKKEKRLKEEADRANKRRIESQLVGLTGHEREQKLKELEEREKHKKGHISDAQEALMLEKQQAYKEKMERLKAQREKFQQKLKEKGAPLQSMKGETAPIEEEKEEENSLEQKDTSRSSEDDEVDEDENDESDEDDSSLDSEDSDYLYDEYSDSESDSGSDGSYSEESAGNDGEIMEDATHPDDLSIHSYNSKDSRASRRSSGSKSDRLRAMVEENKHAEAPEEINAEPPKASLTSSIAVQEHPLSSRSRKSTASKSSEHAEGGETDRSDASTEYGTETTYSSRTGWSMADDMRSNPPTFRTDVTSSTESSYSRASSSGMSSDYSVSSSRRGSDFTGSDFSDNSSRRSSYSESDQSSYYSDSRRSSYSDYSYEDRYTDTERIADSDSAYSSRRSSASSVSDTDSYQYSQDTSRSGFSTDASNSSASVSTAGFSSSRSAASDDYTHRYHSSSDGDSRRSSFTGTDFSDYTARSGYSDDSDTPRSVDSRYSYLSRSTESSGSSYSSSSSYASRDPWNAPPSRPMSAESAARHKILQSLGTSRSQSEQEDEVYYEKSKRKQEKNNSSGVVSSNSSSALSTIKVAGTLSTRVAAAMTSPEGKLKPIDK